MAKKSPKIYNNIAIEKHSLKKAEGYKRYQEETGSS